MLVGLGFEPFFAASICLLANTVPVAFGSIGIPIVMLGGVTSCPSKHFRRTSAASALPFP